MVFVLGCFILRHHVEPVLLSRTLRFNDKDISTFHSHQTDMPYINWLQGNLRFVDKMNFYCLWLAEKNRRTVARGKLIGAQVAARVAGRQVVKDSRACVIM